MVVSILDRMISQTIWKNYAAHQRQSIAVVSLTNGIDNKSLCINAAGKLYLSAIDVNSKPARCDLHFIHCC
jgi:hypothetical protein